MHIPGSDALGVVIDAGSAVKDLKIGQAVILDSWTGKNLIRGYETHDGFNAQFAIVDEERAIPVPEELKAFSPERLAAVLLTYGTAYRAIVERLTVSPGESVLLLGGGIRNELCRRATREPGLLASHLHALSPYQAANTFKTSH